MNTTTSSDDKSLKLADELGRRAGEDAASWVIQDLWGGRATRGEKEAAQSVLRQLEDGDPAIYDAFRIPNLSGEWAGDPIPFDLFQECTGHEYFPEQAGNQEFMDELCTAWETAVSDAFFSTLEKSAREFLNQ
jgi:hypothetical protein